MTLLETNDKLCCLQRISVHYQNCIVCSESAFAAENGVVCNDLAFTAKVVFSVASQCSLPKLCCVQWISAHCWKFVLSAANQRSLPKLCCMQRISVRYWNYVVCSELVFTAEIVLCAANHRSLQKIELSAANQRSLLKIVLCAVNQRSLLKLCCV
jgi:hypothetical protein